MNNYRNITIAICLSLTFLLLFNISSFAYQCSEIRANVIRLHVIANSDSDEDQKLKLKVRDEILRNGAEIFDGTVTIENAVSEIKPKIASLEQTAEKVIKDNGFNYNVRVTLEEEYFDTRTYNNEVTLPAGKYLALKIVIGEGKGKNWWCVMFPSLCLPAVEKTEKEALDSVFTSEDEEIVLNSDKYEVRFRIVELIEKLKGKANN